MYIRIDILKKQQRNDSYFYLLIICEAYFGEESSAYILAIIQNIYLVRSMDFYLKKKTPQIHRILINHYSEAHF